MTKEIYTERLILHPLDKKDAPELFAIRSLEEVYKYIFSGPWLSIGEAEKWIKRNTNGLRCLMYTIFLKISPEEDRIIGVVGLNAWDQVHIMIDPKFSGLGYAPEALKAFLISLFRLQPKRLSIGTLVSADNLASRKMLEVCGFVPDAPKTFVAARSKEEITEREELNALEGLGYKHTEGKDDLFFRYVNRTGGETASETASASRL